ncbi:MAG: T9SS type A sorting domain-containing protein, partial [Bacteroidota bacterium]|nr:T9SS type A sorting domain-containing protein [Bacteroidota bacterium]
ITGTTTNHVWFPSGKSSDLIISDIGSANYQNLKLSFDIAAYKLAEANVNKLTVYCNDSMLALPSVTFASSKFISVTGIELRNSNAITLKFQYTAENNTNGYRLDNFRITGVRVTSAINNPSAFRFNPIVAGRNVILRDVADGTVVEIYDMLGSEVQASKLEGGLFVLNNSLSTGFYIIRIGQINGKIRL